MREGEESTRGGLIPEHEPFRRALQWLSIRRAENPDARIHELVTEASRRFDLSPKEELTLLQFLVPAPEEQ